MNHYQTLKVDKKASEVEIARAYFTMVYRHYSSTTKNKAYEAAALAALKYAFGVLNNKDAKQEYDEEIDNPVNHERFAIPMTEEPQFQPLTEEESFVLILNHAHINTDMLLDWAVFLACTNNKLFNKYCDRLIEQLNPEQLLFLVQMGPKIVSQPGKKYPRERQIKLTFCNPSLNRMSYINFKQIAPLTAAYKNLLSKIIQKASERLHSGTHQLSIVEVSALFMGAMIFSEAHTYHDLCNMQLESDDLKNIKDQLVALLNNKRALAMYYRVLDLLDDREEGDLLSYLSDLNSTLRTIVKELQLENQYKASIRKEIDLLVCYEKSTRCYHFTSIFVKHELDRFSMKERKDFIQNLIARIDSTESLAGLSFPDLVSNHIEDAIDVLFNVVRNKILRVELEPFRFFQHSNDKRISVAKIELEENTTFTMNAQIQFIQAIAAQSHSSGCIPHGFFNARKRPEHPLVIYCGKWAHQIEEVEAAHESSLNNGHFLSENNLFLDPHYS